MNMPMYAMMADCAMDELEYSRLMIRVDDPDDHAFIDQLAEALERLPIKGADVIKKYNQNSSDDDDDDDDDDDESTTDKIEKILNKVFYGLITVTMFLCFFSLSASMSSNLYSQKKEVGVLRAMGFTKYRLRMLYFYEALILVLSSCILGVLIGCLVGWTMLLQFNLFLSQTADFFFPWKQFALVFGLSIICAFLSTWGPAATLTNRSIAGIFRLV